MLHENTLHRRSASSCRVNLLPFIINAAASSLIVLLHRIFFWNADWAGWWLWVWLGYMSSLTVFSIGASIEASVLGLALHVRRMLLPLVSLLASCALLFSTLYSSHQRALAQVSKAPPPSPEVNVFQGPWLYLGIYVAAWAVCYLLFSVFRAKTS